MATLKKIKYPKAPKATASVEVKQRYIARCKEIDRENARRAAENKKSAALTAQIRKMRSK